MTTAGAGADVSCPDVEAEELDPVAASVIEEPAGCRQQQSD
nr:hypothetical protein [Corynebacterium auriscanis]